VSIDVFSCEVELGRDFLADMTSQKSAATSSILLIMKILQAWIMISSYTTKCRKNQ
jgi:hypothetical protein